MLSPDFYAELLAHLCSVLKLDLGVTEISIEANPGSSERQKFVAYRQAGINRISLGAQSFCDSQLKRLGRVHVAQDGLDAFAAARQAGFDSINLDLMYGLPQQTQEDALADLRQAIQLQPEHISHYQLTLEPNTRFHAEPPTGLPDDELVAGIEQQAAELLQGEGFVQYEVSAWAREGKRAKHNLNYWQFGDYLGLGAGAHSKLSFPASAQNHKIVREWKYRSPTTYMDSAKQLGGQRLLTADDLAYEFMLNALRLVDGFPLALFGETTGLADSIIMPNINKGKQLGLLDLVPAGPDFSGNRNGNYLVPSTRGREMLNELIELFAPASSSSDLTPI